MNAHRALGGQATEWPPRRRPVRPRRRLLVRLGVAAGLLVLLAGVLVLVATCGPPAGEAAPPGPPAAPPAVTDDDPGWDCRTMGNRLCGPGAVAPDGTPVTPGDYGRRGVDQVADQQPPRQPGWRPTTLLANRLTCGKAP